MLKVRIILRNRFVKLPADRDATQLFNQAVEIGVAVVAGQSFFVDGSGNNTFRLSYSNASMSDIEIGITKLGRILKEGMNK